jgi:peptide/nickel transport system permease protein
MGEVTHFESLPTQGPRFGELVRRWRRPKWAMILSGVIVVIVVVAIVFPSVMATYDPLDVQVKERLEPPSAEHWFGTDGAGRDIYSRMVHGARYSIGMTLVIVISAAVLGTLWGGVSGYLGGRNDQAMMRFVDIFLAFPYFILALAIASALGRGMTSAVLALVLVWWPGYARMVRGLVLSIKEDAFIEAARAIGVSTPRLIVRHILPQTTSELNARVTLDMGFILLALTGLSFLGLGAQNPTPEWGVMVADSRLFIFRAWWYGVFPGVVIFLTVLAFMTFGDAVADRQFR